VIEIKFPIAKFLIVTVRVVYKKRRYHVYNSENSITQLLRQSRRFSTIYDHMCQSLFPHHKTIMKTAKIRAAGDGR